MWEGYTALAIPGGDMQLWARGTQAWKGHAAAHMGGGGSQERGRHPVGQAQHPAQAGGPGSGGDIQPWIHPEKG